MIVTAAGWSHHGTTASMEPNADLLDLRRVRLRRGYAVTKPAAGYWRVSRTRDDMTAPALYREDVERFCHSRRIQLSARERRHGPEEAHKRIVGQGSENTARPPFLRTRRTSPSATSR